MAMTHIDLIYITNKPQLAQYAQDSGVDRIMIDLEVLGKKERQKHLDTLISNHTLQDIKKVREVLDKAKLQVRVNPINPKSKDEIDKAISNGADIIMLPMFTRQQEVEKFISYVSGRAETTLLLETAQALGRLNNILQVENIDEIHIGLNDLRITMGLDFLFETLSGGIIEYLSEKINRQGIRFGFGGITRLGKGIIDSRLVLSEHIRLKSQVTILSRDFHGRAETLKELKQLNLKSEIKKIREYINYLSTVPEDILQLNKQKISQIITDYVNSLHKRSNEQN